MSSLETCSGGGQLRIDSLIGFVGQLQHLYVVPLLLTAVIGTVRSLSHPSKIFEVHNQLSDEYCSNGPLQLLAHLRLASSYEKTALAEDHQIRYICKRNIRKGRMACTRSSICLARQLRSREKRKLERSDKWRQISKRNPNGGEKSLLTG